MHKASELMTAAPMTLSSETTVTEAVQFFITNSVTTMPVLGSQGEILGQISDLSLLKAYVLSQAHPDKTMLIGQFRNLFEKPLLISEKAPLADVLKSLQESVTHRVLVIDASDRLIGIISPKDLLRFMRGEEKPSVKLVHDLKGLQTKVDSLNQTVKGLNKDLNQYQEIYKSNFYMMHSIDATGKIMMANEKLHQTLGYKPNELIGKTILDLYPDHLHKVVEAGLEKLRTGGETDHTYSTFLTHEGKPMRVELASSIMKSDKGDFVGTFTISRELDSETMLKALHGIFKEKS
jgi:PAS domain S-box-containing protein